jgi:hypothetical protein
VPSFASSRAWALIARLGLFCGTLLACTEQPTDDGGVMLVRHVQSSTQNEALFFDGIDAYATTGTAQFAQGRDAQTVSAWFEVDALVGKHALITLRKDIDSGLELGLQDGVLSAWRVSEVVAHGGAATHPLIAATAPVSAGVWHYATYTFNTATNQLYLDGVLVASNTAPPDERTPTTCWLGTLDGVSDFFLGSIDDFRVSATVHAAAQIMDEFKGAFSGTANGVVLDLPCNEDGGALIYDHSTAANDGLLGDGLASRMPTRVQSGAPSTDMD